MSSTTGSEATPSVPPQTTPTDAQSSPPPQPRLHFLDLVLTLVAGGLCLVAALHGLKVMLGPDRLTMVMSSKDPAGLILLFFVFFAVVVIAVWVGVVRHGRAAPGLLALRPFSGRWWWLAPLCILLLSVALDEGFLRLVRALAGVDLTPQTSQVIAGLATTLPLALAATAAIGLLGPFAEELLFRGLIYGYVDGRFGARAAWATSSVLFALAHAEPAHVALVFPIGVLLGWVRMRSASLWPCVLAHMINNIVVVCWAYLDS
ncbi:CPBP family intramembrane metalloprotease [Vineibacter terrae]|uniref:CPBP family intramembrane metalloprotease n=1 Tax=Vineibacter terrae TaxID=2586908 RepID=A0A5C8PV34_9HYPH|nr:CPBP family intramembrane glutamic endopeptidase [Vineibacter terrae]TXL81833.1 CPBP family intramembrane metalloprotease [Vineibacter terrae]